MDVGDQRWDDGGGARLWVVVWVESLLRRRRRSGTTVARQSSNGITLRGVQMYCETTHSITCIQIRIQVAEWVVPQHVWTPPNELRNHVFRNMYMDPYTCYGMGSSATKTVPNIW